MGSTLNYDRIAHFEEHYLPHLEPVVSTKFLTSVLSTGGFFTAPASSSHHLNYEGGLYDHSCHVTDALVDLTSNNHLSWSRPESPYIIGMFHDLCKSDAYNPVYENRHLIDETDKFVIVRELTGYSYNKETLLKGHGDKSVMLASAFMTLTFEEILCIRYHMGAFTDKEEWNDYTRAIHNCPNVLWTHQADMIATHITEADK